MPPREKKILISPLSETTATLLKALREETEMLDNLHPHAQESYDAAFHAIQSTLHGAFSTPKMAHNSLNYLIKAFASATAPRGTPKGNRILNQGAEALLANNRYHPDEFTHAIAELHDRAQLAGIDLQPSSAKKVNDR